MTDSLDAYDMLVPGRTGRALRPEQPDLESIGDIMRKAGMFIFAIALCSASLFAQKPKTVEYGGSPSFEAPAEEVPAALTKIFSNLGPATSAYSSNAWSLNGPLSAAGGSQFIAMPFTPKANAHVSQLRAALQYNGSGANQARLSLYSDVSGAPGVLLAGPVTVKNLPTFFTCCKLGIVNITSTAVVAGTQYWVVADTTSTGTGSDFYGVWAFVAPSKLLVGADVGGGGWFSFQASIQEPAGAVYGTIP